MKVWTTTEFQGHWPVGTAAVVVAATSIEAALALEDELGRMGLPQTIAPDELQLLDTESPCVVVLNNGDY